MEFTTEELREIKIALNALAGNRIQYRLFVQEGIRRTDNEKYLSLDYKLIEKIVKHINKVK
ncbi:hypothetical protein [Clostridium sp. M14]|uniref:hypothetical protein n=1 Tax=Clostridium sp. M14 TaxID=2716311 RepID=UPI0013EED660|nr:hypothetical protein [Clostridium sp. M14]MBZ9693299.1 hypothetical protein [Clostridium sp. M14]